MFFYVSGWMIAIVTEPEAPGSIKPLSVFGEFSSPSLFTSLTATGKIKQKNKE